MSDPVEHAGVEDVLSSIRRLVSDESRLNAEHGARRHHARSPAPRLVLTPALRVMEDEEPAPQAPESAVLSTPDSETAEDAPWKDPRATLFQAAFASNGTPASNAAVNGHSVAEDADLSEDLESSNAAERNRAAAVVQKIAEMEAASGAADQDIWEPDASTTAPFADTPAPQFIRASERVEPVAVTDPVHEMVEDDTTNAVLQQLSERDDAPVIDEEILRDMVVDIVRSELQGALGERVTRNVRKLVRREIQRALAAHNLD